ncbi:S1 RNA-binding domain-containing protein, partial [Oceanospirillum sp. HFRX-1_2]
MSELSFAELFEQSLQEVNMEPGSIVTATVVDIDGDWVTVHAGLKSEGVIPRSQFFNEGEEFALSVGDEVQVA